MKTILAVMILIGTPFYVKAQVDDSFDLDIDPVLSEDIEGVPSDTPSNSLKSDAKQNRSIYIVNQASSGSKAGANSKTEQNDTAISGSRAEDLKRSRQRAEVETELKVTEKIEESRLNDERRRNDILFGDRYREMENANRPVPPPVVAPAPAPVIIYPSDRGEHQEPSQSVVREKELLKSGTPPSSAYFIGMVGFNQFPRAENIQGNGAFGVGLGIETPAHFLVEGMFQYGVYQSTWPWPKQINDYAGIGAIKYQFGNGTIVPLVGATIVYSYRTYEDSFGYSGRQSSSNVLDAGLLGGAEVTITDSFSLGTEFRYFWNLTSQTDGYYQVYFPNQQPLDTFSHYILALTARYNF